MRIISRLRQLYLCHFSKPAADRLVYRAVCRHRPQKIVELGLRDGQRALRMIELARQSAGAEVHYVGMDLFEARPASDGAAALSLKAAHQMLRGAGARVQLVPGNPADGLTRMANALGKVDLLIVPEELDSPSQARVWFFVPRMLHERSTVFVEGRTPDGQPCLRVKSRQEIDQLASAGQLRRAA